MPFLNEHSCRLLDPDQFVRFIRKHVKDENDVDDYKATGKAYDLIIGFRDDETSDVQAHRYKKDSWTEAEARKHCMAHKGKSFEPAKDEEKSLLPWDAPDFGARMERRSFGLREMRVAQENGGPKRLMGYAAVFNVYSDNLGGFREIIMPGAFSKTIQEADIRALWNHNPDWVLGRTKADTLRLKEDKHGLAIEIFPPDTQVARDLVTSIERGDVDQMSFGFRTIRDTWGTEEGMTTRRLMEAELYDVSPVTFPAYPQTVVQTRTALGMDLVEVGAALARLESGASTPEDRALLDRLMRQVDTSLAAAPPQEGHPAEQAEEEQARSRAQHALRRRRLGHLLKL